MQEEGSLCGRAQEVKVGEGKKGNRKKLGKVRLGAKYHSQKLRHVRLMTLSTGRRRASCRRQRGKMVSKKRSFTAPKTADPGE